MIKIKFSYKKKLYWATRYRYLVLLLFVVLIIVTFSLSKKLKFVSYANDENDEINIYMKAKDGVNLEEMDQKVKVVEQIILKQLGGFGDPLASMFTTVGSGNIAPTDGAVDNAREANIRLYLTNFSKRSIKSSEIVQKLEQALKNKSEFSNWLSFPYIQEDPKIKSFLAHPEYFGFVDLFGDFKQYQRPSSKVDIGYKEWLSDYVKREMKVTNASPYDIFRDEVKDFINMKTGFVQLNIREPRFGPRKSNPIELIITGNDDEQRDRVTQEVSSFLSGIGGVFGIKETQNDTGKELFLNLNVRRMEQLGVSPSNVATSVRSAFLGTQVGTVSNSDESIKINVILSQKDRNKLESLENLPIPTKYGTVIPLKQVVALELHQDASRIVRENGKRASTLSADVDLKQIDVRKISELLTYYIPELLVKYPGIGIINSGELADMQDTQKEAVIVGLIGIVGIFFTLLFIFRSLSQPLFVLSILPFGIIGVIFAFLIHGEALSFFGIVGIIGLMGIVINDAIIMVSSINTLMNHKENQKNYIEVVCQGAVERVRPILLTTFTTVAGLIPAVYGWGGSVSVLRPLAMSMAYGLLFGTFITLFLLPSLYIINRDIQKSFSWVGKKIDLFLKGGD